MKRLSLILMAALTLTSCESVKSFMARDLEEEDFIIGQLYVDELVNETPEAKPAGAPAKPIPHLGKPGRQAGGSTMQPDMFSDPKAVKAWLKTHR